MSKIIDIRKTIPRHKTRKWKKRNKADTIVVHTTASANQDPNKTARYHISPNNHISLGGSPGIVYHDFINKKGIIYKCNNYTDYTWHAGSYNKRSIGITMAYKGQTPGHRPTEAQFAALVDHLVVLCLFLKILPKRVIGHRECPSMWSWLTRAKQSKKYKKTCPGMAVDLDALRAVITRRLQIRLKEKGLYLSEIDGLFGRKSKAALKAFKPTGLKSKLINWKKYK